MALKNPIVIRPDTTIGENNAENDHSFLFNCFLDHPALAVVSDTESAKIVLSGRTGSGKTAIVSMIERQQESVSPIDLQEMALDYVANSTIVRFLQSLDVDLDIFFQTLWKHVLCIEFIRLRYAVNSRERSKSVFQNIADFFDNDQRKKAALNYLSEWEGKFWITMDENIKELTTKLEQRIGAEFSAEIAKFEGNAGYARTMGVEKKAQLVARIKKFINPSQLAELNKVLALLSEYDDGDGHHHKKHFILIDRLDEKWVDEEIRYKLIRALIESLRAFRKIHSLKIVVTLRTDVLERVVIENRDLGFQREKYDDYFLRLMWKKEQLKELVQKRINFLYRRKYTSENVHFEDVFKSKIKGKLPFDYMLERTLYRPRDIISFVNLCLTQAQEQTEVYPRNIEQAEDEYSRVRLQALIYEWRSALPILEFVFNQMTGFAERFEVSSFAEDHFVESLALQHAVNDIDKNDPFSELIAAYVKDASASSKHRIARKLAAELYRIGSIGLKLRGHSRYIYSYQDNPIVSEDAIELDVKIHIHPMLHRALAIDKRRKEKIPKGKRPFHQ